MARISHRDVKNAFQIFVKNYKHEADWRLEYNNIYGWRIIDVARDSIATDFATTFTTREMYLQLTFANWLFWKSTESGL